jgi:hypothetical protein
MGPVFGQGSVGRRYDVTHDQGRAAPSFFAFFGQLGHLFV